MTSNAPWVTLGGMKSNKKLEKLKHLIYECFEYEPETGIIYRIKNRNRWGLYKTARKKAGTLSHGYSRIVVTVDGDNTQIAAHRMAWLFQTGKFPKRCFEIDHINGNRIDNRWSNLRLAKRGQNSMNTASPVNNTSGYKGVIKIKRKLKYKPTHDNDWCARIKVEGKTKHLGVFKTFEDAYRVRREAEKKYFGEFSREEKVKNEN